MHFIVTAWQKVYGTVCSSVTQFFKQPYADFRARGLTHVTSVDVAPQVQAPYGSGGVAPTDPASAAFATYYGSCHGSYQPPFCHAQARAMFDTLK